MNRSDKIKNIFSESIAIKKSVLNNADFIFSIETVIEKIVNAYSENKKVLFCGNGGSAADAQRLAAELSGRFLLNRKPLFAEALHVNSSYITATANDYGYDFIFSRLVEAMGNEGDVLMAFSTSGNSENIVNALKVAKEKNMITVGFTGEKGGKINEYSDILFCVPSVNTARVQEVHITIGHIICEMVEHELFGK